MLTNFDTGNNNFMGENFDSSTHIYNGVNPVNRGLRIADLTIIQMAPVEQMAQRHRKMSEFNDMEMDNMLNMFDELTVFSPKSMGKSGKSVVNLTKASKIEGETLNVPTIHNGFNKVGGAWFMYVHDENNPNEGIIVWGYFSHYAQMGNSLERNMVMYVNGIIDTNHSMNTILDKNHNPIGTSTSLRVLSSKQVFNSDLSAETPLFNMGNTKSFARIQDISNEMMSNARYGNSDTSVDFNHVTPKNKVDDEHVFGSGVDFSCTLLNSASKALEDNFNYGENSNTDRELVEAGIMLHNNVYRDTSELLANRFISSMANFTSGDINKSATMDFTLGDLFNFDNELERFNTRVIPIQELIGLSGTLGADIMNPNENTVEADIAYATYHSILGGMTNEFLGQVTFRISSEDVPPHHEIRTMFEGMTEHPLNFYLIHGKSLIEIAKGNNPIIANHVLLKKNSDKVAIGILKYFRDTLFKTLIPQNSILTISGEINLLATSKIEVHVINKNTGYINSIVIPIESSIDSVFSPMHSNRSNNTHIVNQTNVLLGKIHGRITDRGDIGLSLDQAQQMVNSNQHAIVDTSPTVDVGTVNWAELI